MGTASSRRQQVSEQWDCIERMLQIVEDEQQLSDADTGDQSLGTSAEGLVAWTPSGRAMAGET